MKRCSKCHLDLDESQFHRKRKNNRQSMCKDCRKIYIREHYQENRARYIKQIQATKAKNRQYVRDIKSSTPCADCGKYYPYWIMEFDHLHDKDFDMNMGIKVRGINQIKAEISKCDVVCSNCHKDRTYQRLIRVGIEPTM